MSTETCDAFSVRPMTDRHLKRVIEIEGAVFTNPMSRRELMPYINQSSELAGYVAYCGRHIAAYLLFEFGHDGRIRIHGFATHPTFRRQRVARQLFDWLKTEVASSTSHRIVELVVRETNLIAQQFLKSCDFRAIKILPDSFSDTHEDGYLFIYRAPAPVFAG